MWRINARKNIHQRPYRRRRRRRRRQRQKCVRKKENEEEEEENKTRAYINFNWCFNISFIFYFSRIAIYPADTKSDGCVWWNITFEVSSGWVSNWGNTLGKRYLCSECNSINLFHFKCYSFSLELNLFERPQVSWASGQSLKYE